METKENLGMDVWLETSGLPQRFILKGDDLVVSATTLYVRELKRPAGAVALRGSELFWETQLVSSRVQTGTCVTESQIQDFLSLFHAVCVADALLRGPGLRGRGPRHRDRRLMGCLGHQSRRGVIRVGRRVAAGIRVLPP